MLVGCGVPTGWGAAVNTAKVQAGDTVVVVGIGGIGINAVQGARLAGAKNIIAIDPLENKREKAMELGATHSFASTDEAMEALTDMTRGQMADSAILTPGLMTSEIVAGGFHAVGKGGIVVLTGLNKLMEQNIELPGTILTLFRKSIKGSLFGDCNPTVDIPKILGLYQSGDIKLDEIITQHLHPRPGQRGLRRPARRQERARCRRAQPQLSDDDVPHATGRGLRAPALSPSSSARPRQSSSRRPCSAARTCCSRARRAPASRRCCARSRPDAASPSSWSRATPS